MFCLFVLSFRSVVTPRYYNLFGLVGWVVILIVAI